MQVDYRQEFCRDCQWTTDHHVVTHSKSVIMRCIVCNHVEIIPDPNERALDVISTEFKILAVHQVLGKDGRNKALVERTQNFFPFRSGPVPPKKDIISLSYSVQDGRHLCSNFTIESADKTMDHPTRMKLAGILKQVFNG